LRHIQAGNRRKPVVVPTADEPVDAVGVRPVGLDGDGVEAVLDEPLRDLPTELVELVRAVRSLAEEDEPLAARASGD